MAAGLFFIGWQYKQSLALHFGLPAYPGDISFQSTVATGLTVFDAPQVALLAAAFAAAFGAITFVRAIPHLLTRWLKSMERRIESTDAELDEIAENAENAENATSIIEAKLNALSRRNRRISREHAILGSILKGAIPTAIVMLVISGALTGLGIALLFVVGSQIAEKDANNIRAEARGRCDGCFLYDIGSDAFLGVPVFQSSDIIYVQEYDGLYRVRAADLKVIKTFRKATDKPLTRPRG